MTVTKTRPAQPSAPAAAVVTGDNGAPTAGANGPATGRSTRRRW